MGSFITNLHLRGAECDTVVAALQSLRATPAYVCNVADAAWISIFPESADQDMAGLWEFGGGLSRTLQRPVIGFMVHDGAIFFYGLFDNDAEIDRYDPAPAYFDGRDLEPGGGDVDILKRYCAPATTTMNAKAAKPAKPLDCLKDNDRRRLR